MNPKLFPDNQPGPDSVEPDPLKGSILAQGVTAGALQTRGNRVSAEQVKGTHKTQ